MQKTKNDIGLKYIFQPFRMAKRAKQLFWKSTLKMKGLDNADLPGTWHWNRDSPAIHPRRELAMVFSNLTLSLVGVLDN